MTTQSSEAALVYEHREIDTDIEEFIAGLDRGVVRPESVRRAFDVLRRHIYLEEELLFPPIKRAGLQMPIFVMTREHGELWGAMDQIDQLIEAAAPTIDSIRSACSQLLGSLGQHNIKEEPIIYPHTSIDLTEAEATALADFIAEGEFPTGWVCEAAR